MTLGVAVNPLVVWLWLGGLVMAFGTGVALVPTRRRKLRLPPSPDPAPVAAGVEENDAELAEVVAG